MVRVKEQGRKVYEMEKAVRKTRLECVAHKINDFPLFPFFFFNIS